MRKQRFRDLWWFVQSHVAKNWQSWVFLLDGLVCSELSGLHNRRATLRSKSQVQRFTLDTVSIQCPGPCLLLFSPSPTSFSLSLTRGATLMVGLLGARQRGCCKRLLGMASGRLTQVQAMVKSASCGCSQDCSSREKNENLTYFSCNPTPRLDLHRESSIRAQVLSKWP